MKCHFCHKEINGKYYIDQWGHNICASHMDKKEVTMCTSCGAFTENSPLHDGRCLCNNCKSSVISTHSEISASLTYVKNLLVSVGFDFGTCNIDNIPIEIVSARRMAEIQNTSISTNNKGVTRTETQMRGTFKSDMKVVGHTHNIYMLSDQSRLEFLGTLAHELLHVWQNEHDIKLSPMKCEGLCNMGSYLIYLTENSPIAQHYIKNLKESPDSIYGDGFRYVFAKYETSGWREIINRVNNNAL